MVVKLLVLPEAVAKRESQRLESQAAAAGAEVEEPLQQVQAAARTLALAT